MDFSGPDADLLLEKNATLLHAFEHVALKAIRLDEDHFRKIAFDCQDWRRMRIEELQLMAQVAAERVIDTGDPFTLNPMNARERRIIHLALKRPAPGPYPERRNGTRAQSGDFPSKVNGLIGSSGYRVIEDLSVVSCPSSVAAILQFPRITCNGLRTTDRFSMTR